MAPSLTEVYLILGLLALATTPQGARAKGFSSKCKNLGPNDVVIAVCLQNDFFDERPVDGRYAKGAPLAYPIDEANKNGASVRRGALAVRRSEEVVPVANEWMRKVDDAGGTVITTLDWHPPEHCSFCRFGPKLEKRLDCVWGCNGTQGICVTGAGVPTAVFDSSSRCTDPVSDLDFQQSRYFQWPTHCIMDTFSSKFDPYLQVPSRAVQVRSGTESSKDSYSAFGATERESGKTLLEVLRDHDARRVFILGLATDYVVKETLVDLITHTKGDPTKEAILVAAGSRGVFDSPGDFYGSDPETSSGRIKADLLLRGGNIVAAEPADRALEELCDGTCDTDADCVVDSSSSSSSDVVMVCSPGVPYNRCVKKPKYNRDVMLPLSITLAAVIGAFVAFRKEIIDYLSNRHKRRGPPMDYVVLVETDIQGSSELWETMGARGQGDIMKEGVMGIHDEVLRRSMKRHFGYELFVRGDSFVVAFHSVEDALAWCLQVQLDLMASDWPAECHDATAGTERVWGTYEGLRVRMGVHCGRVESAIKHQGKVVYDGEVMRQVTGITDSGNGGQIILSQATLPLPANIDIPFTVYDQGMHRVKGFHAPQRLKEVYPETLSSRCANWRDQKLDTEERLSPAFHAAPEGLVTMIYCHAVGLADLKNVLEPKVVDECLLIMAEVLRRCMMQRNGYDCRGHERNGENMYTFGNYLDCVLFAAEAQDELNRAEWPAAMLEHNEKHDADAAESSSSSPDEDRCFMSSTTRVRGLRVRMGMHSGQLKRIRIPSEGLADYYGESANRAARVMSTAVGGQVVCVASELEYFLEEYISERPRLIVDPLGTFTLKGIPGQTALVQVALTEELAEMAGRRFVQSKKAQLVAPATGERTVKPAVDAERLRRILAENNLSIGGGGNGVDLKQRPRVSTIKWASVREGVKTGRIPSREGSAKTNNMINAVPDHADLTSSLGG